MQIGRSANTLPVADMTRIVFDPALGTTRKVIAGQPIPPDLIGPYNDEVGTHADAGHENDVEPEITTTRPRRRRAS